MEIQYVANDGEIFETEEECRGHEEATKVKDEFNSRMRLYDAKMNRFDLDIEDIDLEQIVYAYFADEETFNYFNDFFDENGLTSPKDDECSFSSGHSFMWDANGECWVSVNDFIDKLMNHL
jgi:hypothetical protein